MGKWSAIGGEWPRPSMHQAKEDSLMENASNNNTIIIIILDRQLESGWWCVHGDKVKPYMFREKRNIYSQKSGSLLVPTDDN